MDNQKSASSGDKENSIFQTILNLDKKISLLLSLSASKKSPLGALRPHMKALELSCHGVFWISFSIICLWFTSDPVKEAFFFNILLALLFDVVLVAIMKASLRRRRPANNEDGDMFLTWSVDKMSCPSGHTSRAVMMALLLISSTPGMYLLHPVLIVWCLSTCLSRVLLGRHYLGDVLIGMALGYEEYYFMCYMWASPESAKWYLDFFRESNAFIDDM